MVADPNRAGDLRLPYCGGVFLLTEHTAHVFDALPWLLILACPLMQIFMHHGRHGGHGQARRSSPDSEAEQDQ